MKYMKGGFSEEINRIWSQQMPFSCLHDFMFSCQKIALSSKRSTKTAELGPDKRCERCVVALNFLRRQLPVGFPLRIKIRRDEIGDGAVFIRSFYPRIIALNKGGQKHFSDIRPIPPLFPCSWRLIDEYCLGSCLVGDFVTSLENHG